MHRCRLIRVCLRRDSPSHFVDEFVAEIDVHLGEHPQSCAWFEYFRRNLDRNLAFDLLILGCLLLQHENGVAIMLFDGY